MGQLGKMQANSRKLGGNLAAITSSENKWVLETFNKDGFQRAQKLNLLAFENSRALAGSGRMEKP